MKKWIDEKTGEAMADKEERKGGYVPIICLYCGGKGCDNCDEDGVMMIDSRMRGLFDTTKKR